MKLVAGETIRMNKNDIDNEFRHLESYIDVKCSFRQAVFVAISPFETNHSYLYQNVAFM
jgi:hypothetical protein